MPGALSARLVTSRFLPWDAGVGLTGNAVAVGSTGVGMGVSDKGRFLMINMEEPCSLGWKKIRRLGWVAVPHRLQSRISGCQLELPNPTFLVMLGFACQCRNRVFVKYHIPEVWIYHDGRQICNPEKPGFFHAAQPQPTDLDFF